MLVLNGWGGSLQAYQGFWSAGSVLISLGAYWCSVVLLRCTLSFSLSLSLSLSPLFLSFSLHTHTHQPHSSVALLCFAGFCCASTSAVAWVVLPRFGWRALTAAACVPIVFTLVMMPLVPRSPMSVLFASHVARVAFANPRREMT